MQVCVCVVCVRLTIGQDRIGVGVCVCEKLSFAIARNTKYRTC